MWFLMQFLQMVVEMESLGCVFTRSGVEMNFVHFTQSVQECHLLYLKLHSPVEVSQLFKCLLTSMVNITIDLVCVCDGIVQYIYCDKGY